MKTCFGKIKFIYIYILFFKFETNLQLNFQILSLWAMNDSRLRKERRLVNQKVDEILNGEDSDQHDLLSNPSDNENDRCISCDDEPLDSSFSSNENEVLYNTLDTVTNPESLILSDISRWAAKSGCSRECLNQLLLILRKHGMTELPADSRTLLETPRHVETAHKCGGIYSYVGIVKQVKKMLKLHHCLMNENNLFLTVNIDGLPLSKSSQSQLWPILGSLNNSDSVFVIALYHGTSKPNSPNEFLEDFLNEVNFLQINGLEVEEKTFQFFLKAFVCDAPARAFLKCVVGHTGYYSCERCNIKGQYIDNRVVFLHDGSEIARNDQHFKQFLYHPHQKCISPLVSQLNFDCVSKFTLDYMHLVLLGVMKRMLQFLTKGPLQIRLSSNHISQISSRLNNISGSMPTEFNRQPRPLRDLPYWKATEFRQFLLYLGPVVLKGIVSHNVYEHFLGLHISMSILLNDSSQSRYRLLGYCRELLLWFVSKSKDVYGRKFISYNVHSLIHLCDDAENFQSSLNHLSAFKFENYMQVLKKNVRSNNNPVAQVIKRESELSSLVEKSKPTPFISADHLKDSCFLLESGKFCVVNEAQKHSNQIIGTVLKPCSLGSIYKSPAESSLLNIFFVEKITGKRKEFPKNMLKRKVVCLPHRNGFALFPFLHEFEKTKY